MYAATADCYLPDNASQHALCSEEDEKKIKKKNFISSTLEEFA